MPCRRLVSVVLSFRNEQEVLPELVRQLQKTFLSLPVECEFIFVNDASTDQSLPLLVQKGREDKRIKIINMSRRFGVPDCALAGIRYAQGDAVIVMDADLQDPPEVIPQLIDKWVEGADVAYTVRTVREGESALRSLLVRWAYGLIRRISDIDLAVDAGDFKLMSRRVVNELIKLNEKSPYLRGLVSWVGFKQVPVFYRRRRRFAGRSHFPLCSGGLVGTLISGMTAFSVFPLTFFLGMGLLICLGSLFFLLAKPLAAAILFLIGMHLMGIGTLGLYLGKVYDEVRGRPNYIVESTIGFGQEGDRE